MTRDGGEPLTITRREEREPAHSPLATLVVAVKQVEGHRTPLSYRFAGGDEQRVRGVTQTAPCHNPIPPAGT